MINPLKLPNGTADEVRDFREMWVRSQALASAVAFTRTDEPEYAMDTAHVIEIAEQFERYIKEGVY